jgi:hypothetical protein
MGWIGCVRCEKFQCEFVAQTFALVRYVLLRDWYGNLMVPNAPKWYEVHQNKSLGSNGVDQVHSLRKILTRLCGTNICTSSDRFAPSFVKQPNGSKCTQMVRNATNMSLGSNGVDGCFRCEKFQCEFVAQTFALVWYVLLRDW